MGTITNLTLRFDLEKNRDREVWERLHSDYKEKYKTCNNAVLEILKEHIVSDDTSENISRKLSESVKNAIRDEFSRIISPSPPVQAPPCSTRTPTFSGAKKSRSLSPAECSDLKE